MTVEIVIKNELNELYLTKRAIEPCKGMWHLPGGTVRFGESLEEAVSRVAERELRLKALVMKSVGYIEYPSHYTTGLDCPIGIVFEITKYDGSPRINHEAQESNWFKHVPKDMHADQDVFLLHNGYLENSLE